MSLRLFVIYLDYRLYSSILFKIKVCGLQEKVNTIFDIACQVKKCLFQLPVRKFTKEHNNSISFLKSEVPKALHILLSSL